MCLSTVYKNTMAPETIVMKNVMRIDCKDGCVILTDLMERTVSIEGTLETANLVDGFVVVNAARFFCLFFQKVKPFLVVPALIYGYFYATIGEISC